MHDYDETMAGIFGEDDTLSGLSQNLLAEDRNGNQTETLRTPNTPSTTSASMSSLSANLIEKIVKKAQEPLREEIKGMRRDMAALTKKITSVENGMQNDRKQSREILTSVDQKKGNINTLLTQTGAITLKSRCFLNLDIDANMEAEHEILDTFFDEAKENGWLMSETAKRVKDIKVRFREERNVIKQQVKRNLPRILLILQSTMLLNSARRRVI